MYEQEIKLTADNNTVLTQVLQSELVQRLDTGIGKRDAVPYIGVYYDTADGALAQSRCSLRARREGARWRAAFKFGGGIENGLSRRNELEADISGWLDTAAQLPHGALADKVAEIIPADAPLVERVRVEMQRSIRNLNFKGTHLELVADNAIIKNGRRRKTLYEIELELKAGDIDKVVELGNLLKQRFDLTPSTMSKHRIGLQLEKLATKQSTAKKTTPAKNNGAVSFELAHASGRVTPARFVESPNCDSRPDSTAIEVLVIHAISLPPRCYDGNHIEQFFTNRLAIEAHPYFAKLRELKVSAHFLIRRSGELLQFVPTHKRAWHAGESNFDGRERVNDFSLGIELEGCDEEPFEPAQYEMLSNLARFLMDCYPIQPERIVSHSEISPGRKTDPGPCFDWNRFRRGISGGV